MFPPRPQLLAYSWLWTSKIGLGGHRDSLSGILVIFGGYLFAFPIETGTIACGFNLFIFTLTW